VAKAGITRQTGLAGDVNVQGEDQKKLDVIANQVFINALQSSGQVCAMVSEENENMILVSDKYQKGPYAVVFDPLDGSSNIDCGVSIGSIFGIYKLPEDHTGSVADWLCSVPGSAMVASGMAMYGSSTMLALTMGHGVNGYTLDPSIGEFILTHENIQVPTRGSIYSINEGNSIYWDDAVKEYIRSVKEPKEGKPYSCRYVGSGVADVWRTLLYGGIFLYPTDSKSKSGKLRILYEVFPVAMITEQAGGLATTGNKRALDLIPASIHERSGLVLGSRDDVKDVERFYSERARL